MQKLPLYRYIRLANLVKIKSLIGLFNFYVVVDYRELMEGKDKSGPLDLVEKSELK